MIKRIAITASALAVLAAAANAQSPFFSAASTNDALSFSDVTGSTGTLMGQGSTGYTVFTPFGTYTNVSYNLIPAATYTIISEATDTTNGFQAILNPDLYSITFSGTSPLAVFDPNVLTITFDSALIQQGSFSATEDEGFAVLFSGTVGDKINAISGALSNNGFDFALTSPIGTDGPYITPTSFTISAAPVPEPATLAALGFGALAMLRRRRKA